MHLNRWMVYYTMVFFGIIDPFWLFFLMGGSWFILLWKNISNFDYHHPTYFIIFSSHKYHLNVYFAWMFQPHSEHSKNNWKTYEDLCEESFSQKLNCLMTFLWKDFCLLVGWFVYLLIVKLLLCVLDTIAQNNQNK